MRHQPLARLCRLIPILLALVLIAAGTSYGKTLRVGLIRRLKSVSEVSVTSLSEFAIFDAAGQRIASCASQDEITLAAKDGEITFTRANGASASVGTEVSVTVSDPDGAVSISRPKVAPSQYRGKIIVKAVDRALLLVNIIDVEDYLLSVLPSEMPADFNAEALKAQAVAARTYAYICRGRHEKLGYDLCDSTDCQVYLGAGQERTSSTEAVKETAGLVATYGGSLITALYCGDCGGMTRDGGKPYLVATPDRPEDASGDFCDHDGHCWSKSWPIADFEKLLQKSHPKIIDIKSITIDSSDDTGRVNLVKIEAEEGSTDIPGASVRTMLGNGVIRSTAFTVKIEDGSVIFEGKGFGHGVGLCQFGANGLAASPNNYTFDKILKHYYNGIEIKPISEVE